MYRCYNCQKEVEEKPPFKVNECDYSYCHYWTKIKETAPTEEESPLSDAEKRGEE